MNITFKDGDMFSEQVHALVNTVNCVGVMGKGVALQFKNRWPENFKQYKKLCDMKQLVPGQMFVYDHQGFIPTKGPRYLINFPTKNHWRAKSKLSYIEEGLDALRTEIEKNGIKSIAIPPLGCGNGGLNWADVKPLIERKLSSLSGVDIIVLNPTDSRGKAEHFDTKLTMTFARAVLLKSLNDLEVFFDGSFDRVSLQKIVYFLQVMGINFNLQFSRNLYGPYSEVLKKAFVSLEKNGMIDGFTKGERQAHVTNSGFASADEFLSKSSNAGDEAVQRLIKLVQGYESPYGLELLSSVHWLVFHEGHYPVEKIIQQMNDWNEGKRNNFDDASIRRAYARLHEDGLLH